jgi:alkanesulfonate monooxygenase SsuD/methylene tetrahydromethanopterin reductase-like flavin-dependent oxidoreductase (luciferase family)
MAQLPLSVIYTQWPGDLPRLVPILDALGYSRFWATEHHSPTQSASPIVAATVAAGLSSRMRVGTAGVMIQAHSPLRVAQDFRLLDTLYPDRVDLGIIRNTPSGLALPGLLDGRPAPQSSDYSGRVEEVARLMRRQAKAGHLHGSRVGPISKPRTRPQLWLCGMSETSARLAGRLGMGYAFHHQINSWRPTPQDGPAILAAYRDAFVPDDRGTPPRTVIVCYGTCADTDTRAHTLWNEIHTEGRPPADSTQIASFMGTPDQCREQLLDLRHRYAADEIALQTFARPLDDRIRGYELLADAFDLPSAPRPAAQRGDRSSRPSPSLADPMQALSMERV